MDYRQKAITLFDELQTHPLFIAMGQTIEASPWHREANVRVHTQMVVSEYFKATDAISLEWTHNDYLGSVATMFHDVGKPASKVKKYREDRGHYFAFHGHEIVSSRLFETFACENPGMFTAEEIFKICWMIEHHMPWSIEVAEKRKWLALTAKYIGVDVYTRALLADQYGRIADDQEAKDKRSEEWVVVFKDLCHTVGLDEIELDAPKLYVLIGTSGSGKSTLTKQIKSFAPGLVDVFSLDALRHSWYDAREDHEGYRIAYEQSVADKEFESKADRVFTNLVKHGNDIVLDNVNAGVKRRGKYIRQARQHGYKIVAITMPISVNTVLERQHTRPDKFVPDHAVRMQYSSIQQPSLGEFDDIVVSDHNMKPFCPED